MKLSSKFIWLSRVALPETIATRHTTATNRSYKEGAGAGVREAAAEVPDAEVPDAEAPLTDSLGRGHNYLRISLTERCNLRCQYCMPADGVPLSRRSELLTRVELGAVVRALAAVGVDKLRLTGGEPTLRPDLPDIIEELGGIPGIRSVSMTTNGLVLTRKLPALQRAGLAAVNVSLDSLREDRYERMARRPGLARVLAGVDLALQLGMPVKLNTVLMKGFNEDEICDFVELTKDRDMEVRFIEFMPFSGNAWEDARMVPYREALRAVSARHPALQGGVPRAHETARVWRVPGYRGRVGFISSMTDHFCATCNRLRLTADGNLKVCLFGAAEVSLRDALRAGARGGELVGLVRAALARKLPRHAARAYSTRAGAGAADGLSQLDESGAGAADGGSDGFSHLDASGTARMVDVGEKAVTRRRAVAECRLQVSARLMRLLLEARLPKGDALCCARLAGALAAKRTAELIPLCHPLPLELARVEIAPARGGGALRLRCEVRVTARTGAEMEALTGCAVAALALYDMCKSVDKDMRITDLRLVRKEGGRSSPPAPPLQHNYSVPPADEREPFVPVNLIYF